MTCLLAFFLRKWAISSPYTYRRREEGNASPQQILDFHRQLPHANAGCVVDSVCDGCGKPGHTDLSDPACANLVDFFVRVIEEVHLDRWRVGIYRYDVVRETAIDGCAVLRIVRGVL